MEESAAYVQLSLHEPHRNGSSNTRMHATTAQNTEKLPLVYTASTGLTAEGSIRRLQSPAGARPCDEPARTQHSERLDTMICKRTYVYKGSVLLSGDIHEGLVSEFLLTSTDHLQTFSCIRESHQRRSK